MTGALAETLEALGFSRNEARAYLALVTHGAMTGYEVGQRAGIPRSAVYGALRKLAGEGAARAVAGPPETFVATPPDALVASLRRRFDQQTKAFEEAARTLDVAPDVPDAFAVRGYERILEEAARVVKSAARVLVLSGWPRELSLLVSELAAAERKGVFVVVFSHARLPPELPGTRFSTGLAEHELEAFWKHRLVVVADDTRTLVGATERLASDRAVVSETAAIAEIVVSQVALDLTLLAERHGLETGPLMAKLLGERVGRMGPLLPTAEPELGVVRSAGKRERRAAPKAR